MDNTSLRSNASMEVRQRPRVTKRRLRLLAVCACLGAAVAGYVGGAATAKADPIDTAVAAYATKNAAAICADIAANPTVALVTSAVGEIVSDGFTPYQAGQVIALSVGASCPEQLPVLQRFIDYYTAAPTAFATNTRVGGRIA